MQATTIIIEDRDANLMALIHRHDALWAEWDRLNAIEEYHPGIEAISRECCEIELKILLEAAVTVVELIGKRRVIERGDLSDDFGIIDAIFERDAARVRAGVLSAHP